MFGVCDCTCMGSARWGVSMLLWFVSLVLAAEKADYKAETEVNEVVPQ